MSAAFAAAPKDTPEALVQSFYAAYLKARIPGVPNAAGRARLHDFLSPDLEAALARADAAEADYARETNNEVPPLVEGDLFTSLFEGATQATLKACTREGAAARCRVDLRYDDGSARPAATWQDTLLLTQVQDLGWRIADIEFGGTWEFAHKDRLSDVLKQVVWDAKSISQ